MRIATDINNPAFRAAFFFLADSTNKGCLEWNRARNACGYGLIHAGKETLAHRIAWAIKYGPIPKGIQVLHRCDNPPCINPKHLFTGTQNDNIHDAVRKNRHWRPIGVWNVKAKLNAKTVRQIRAIWKTRKFRQWQIASRFRVALGTVTNILRGTTWKHIR